MQKEQNFFSSFVIFFVLSLLLFVLSNFGVLSAPQHFLEFVLSPLQRVVYQAVASSQNQSSPIVEENKKLTQELASLNNLKKENAALRDQFETTTPRSSTLLPAHVVGAPGFLPGVGSIESLIVDKGSSDGLKAGQAVVFQNNLVGKITKVTPSLSEVSLVTNENSSFAAMTDKGALGVAHGQGSQELVLGNVVLSQQLSKDDIVTTKGDVGINGLGFPPDLIVGKITGVNKEPSSLFQSASVKSLLNFQTLTTVFVVALP